MSRWYPEAASSIASHVDFLFFSLLGMAAFFSVLIAGLVLIFAIKYRRKHPIQLSRPTNQRAFLVVEILWAGIPLLIALTFYYLGARLYLTEFSSGPEEASEIYVVAKQWMWKFEHADGTSEINELHVPANRPIKLIMISQDVIHSFFVPAFRLKHDVLPMRYTTLWFTATQPGTYHLFCAQYCGTKHSAMVGRVIVLEPAEFQKWLAGQSSPRSSLAGESLLENLGCRTCHKTGSSAMAPRLEELLGSRVTLQDGRTQVADANYVRESILIPALKVTRGYQPVMPSYQGRVTEQQIMQILNYLKELKTNSNQGIASDAR